ncbi:unnamed protein product [Brugia pahangi]|uniref:BHLH domain-containing protein n=1 Tax=Brugia pahangi TaxID=6280 RepID=A0A3P7QT59_BRUPA|nr:unnamed protein product [Brugia pahangi]
MQAFVALKFHLPAIRSNAKRVSKLKILRAAINYIAALTDLLRVCIAFVDNFIFSLKDCSLLFLSRCKAHYISLTLQGNADFSKLNASSYYCDDNINVPFRSRRENQLSNKDNVKREELQQRQQCIIPQNIYDTTQCYNKQYWLVDYSLSN